MHTVSGLIAAFGIAIAPSIARAEKGMTSDGGGTYSVSLGGTYSNDNLGTNNSFGGPGLMIDSDIGFMVGDLGGIVVFGRFNTFGGGNTPQTTVEDVQLGLRAFLIQQPRFRISLGAGLQLHHLANSGVNTSALEPGAVFQAGAAYEFARTGEFGFELGGDISIAAHTQSDTNGSSTMAGIAIWIGVRHRHAD